MSDFEINLTDVEGLDVSSIGPMPAGDYEMVGTTWESKKSKANNHKMINITFEVVGPPYAGRKVWENYMLEGNGLGVTKSKLKGWRKAMGMEPNVEAFGIEQLEEMMNVNFLAKMVVKVGEDKGDGTKWADKNVIGNFIPGNGKPVETPKASAEQSDSSSGEDDFDWDK